MLSAFVDISTGTDAAADVMLCYKDGRTAHLIARGDCTLPNNAVIWGTRGIIEVYVIVIPVSTDFVSSRLSERLMDISIVLPS